MDMRQAEAVIRDCENGMHEHLDASKVREAMLVYAEEHDYPDDRWYRVVHNHLNSGGCGTEIGGACQVLKEMHEDLELSESCV